MSDAQENTQLVLQLDEEQVPEIKECPAPEPEGLAAVPPVVSDDGAAASSDEGGAASATAIKFQPEPEEAAASAEPETETAEEEQYTTLPKKILYDTEEVPPPEEVRVEQYIDIAVTVTPPPVFAESPSPDAAEVEPESVASTVEPQTTALSPASSMRTSTTSAEIDMVSPATWDPSFIGLDRERNRSRSGLFDANSIVNRRASSIDITPASPGSTNSWLSSIPFRENRSPSHHVRSASVASTVIEEEKTPGPVAASGVSGEETIEQLLAMPAPINQSFVFPDLKQLNLSSHATTLGDLNAFDGRFQKEEDSAPFLSSVDQVDQRPPNSNLFLENVLESSPPEAQFNALVLPNCEYVKIARPSCFDRIPLRSEFPPEACVRGLAELEKAAHTNPQAVRFVSIEAELTPLSEGVGEWLNRCVNVETLQINGCKKVKRMAQLKLPHLANLDLRNNDLKDVEILANLVLFCPQLQALTLTGNPLVEKFSTALPPVNHPIWKKILFRLPNIEYFNMVLIGNHGRAMAWDSCKSKKDYLNVTVQSMHFALNQMEVIKGMDAWRPELITSIDLSKQSLKALHCSVLAECPQLTRLDVSENQIETLGGSGLHLLTGLQVLDLSSNRLSNPKELNVLSSLPLLLEVGLISNPAMPNYRSWAIYVTRHLVGTNRRPGLQSIDGEAVTTAQTLEAIQQFSKSNRSDQIANEHWRRVLIERYGHKQLQEIPGQLTHMRINGEGLVRANLAIFTGLIHLDLSCNKLVKITGIDANPQLRIVNLSGNPDLDLDLVMAQLEKLTNLEHVSLRSTIGSSAVTTSHQNKILKRLFPRNERLCIIDQKPLTLDQYVTVYAKQNGLKLDEVSIVRYKIDLAITMANSPFIGRNYHPTKVVLSGPQAQITAAEVVSLDLSEQGLTNLRDDLGEMPNLLCLNLSNNALTSLAGLKLTERFSKLQWLDIRNNKIKMTAEELGGIINALPDLHGIAIEGNSSLTSSKYRSAALSAITNLKKLSFPLAFFGGFISIEERVRVASAGFLKINLAAQKEADPALANEEKKEEAAMSPASPSSSSSQPSESLSSLESEENEVFRFHLTLRQACPEGMAAHQIKHLDLSGCQLAWLDLAPFVCLEKLMLHHNRIASLNQSGIKELHQLRVLDVSHNLLSSIEDFVVVVNSLSKLVSVQCSDNPFKIVKKGKGEATIATQAAKYRVFLLSKVACMKEVHHTLRYLDRQLISYDDMVAAALESGRTVEGAESFRFQLVTANLADDVTTLELNEKNLAMGDFTRFSEVERIIISGNRFTNRSLATSGIRSLKKLTELELSGNDIQSASELVQWLRQMPQLTSVSIKRNPCWRTGLNHDNAMGRRKILRYFPNVQCIDFNLRWLNGEKITIDERIESYHKAVKKSRGNTLAGGSADSKLELAVPGMTSPKKTTTTTHLTVESMTTGDSPSPRTRNRTLSGQIGNRSPRGSTLSGGSLTPRGRSANLSIDGSDATSAAAMNQAQANLPENARFVLTMHEKQIALDAQTIDLSECKLVTLGGLEITALRAYEQVTELVLTHNSLVTLEGQGFELLPNLTSLDLRENKLKSLKVTLRSLRRCNALTTLFLQNSHDIERGETNDQASYLPIVFGDLRGVKHCDAQENIHCVRNSELDGGLTQRALQLMWTLNEVGPNNLKQLDLAAANITPRLLFHVLAACVHLGIDDLSLLPHGGNCALIKETHYRVQVICCCKGLRSLDGEEVDVQQKMLALNTGKQLKLNELQLKWDEEIAHQGQVLADEHMKEWNAYQEAERARIQEEEEEAERKHAERIAAERAVATPGAASTVMSPKSISTDVAVPIELDAIAVSPKDGNGKDQDKADKNGENGGQRKRQSEVVGLNVRTIETADVSSDSSNQRYVQIFTQLLYYLQSLGQVIMMDLHLSMPQVFRDVATWVSLFAFDIQKYFDLNLPYQNVLVFIMVLLPAPLAVAAFFYANRLKTREDDWKTKYIHEWSATRRNAIIAWIVSLIISLAVSILAISRLDSLNRLRASQSPTPTSITWVIILGVICTFIFFIWRTFAVTLRKWYNSDESEDKAVFHRKWLNAYNNVQIGLLFILVSIFGPVTQQILTQFQCVCTTDPLTSVHQCSTKNVNWDIDLVDSNGQPLENQCFPHHVSQLQGFVIPIGAIFIIGMPVFIIYLIRNAIHALTAISGSYRSINMKIEELSQTKEMRNQNAGELKQLREQLNDVFFHEANNPLNSIPSTSLFAPYELKYRFWRIFNMAIYLISAVLVVLAQNDSSNKVPKLLQFLTYLVLTITAAAVRPFHHRLENSLEIFSSAVNTINCFCSFGAELQWNWIQSSGMGVFLIAINILTCIFYLISYCYLPFKMVRQRKAMKEQQGEQLQERRKAQREEAERMRKLMEGQTQKQVTEDAAPKAAVADSAGDLVADDKNFDIDTNRPDSDPHRNPDHHSSDDDSDDGDHQVRMWGEGDGEEVEMATVSPIAAASSSRQVSVHPNQVPEEVSPDAPSPEAGAVAPADITPQIVIHVANEA